MRIVNDFNLKRQAEELGVSVWQTPSFMFIVMGLIIIAAMTGTYFISKNYDSPEVVAIAECVVVATILVIGNSIIGRMEQMVRINKLKSEFVSVASHQLRTPLSAIQWEAELILSKFNQGLTAKQREGIESVYKMSSRMSRLVSDLLDVARIDQGKILMRYEEVDMGKVVSEIVEELRPLAKAKDVSILLDAMTLENIPHITGDKEKLKLVVENLLSNSIKYTLPGGSVRINLAVDKKNIQLQIADSGVGIPKSQQDQVFNKFFRSDNVVRYQTDGTGLGLYIAKNIIEHTGGRIWFKSEENKGSVFEFSLPIKSVTR